MRKLLVHCTGNFKNSEIVVNRNNKAYGSYGRFLSVIRKYMGYGCGITVTVPSLELQSVCSVIHLIISSHVYNLCFH